MSIAAAGRARFPGSHQTIARPPGPPGQTRSQTETTGELRMVSPEVQTVFQKIAPVSEQSQRMQAWSEFPQIEADHHDSSHAVHVRDGRHTAKVNIGLALIPELSQCWTDRQQKGPVFLYTFYCHLFGAASWPPRGPLVLP